MTERENDISAAVRGTTADAAELGKAPFGFRTRAERERIDRLWEEARSVLSEENCSDIAFEREWRKFDHENI